MSCVATAAGGSRLHHVGIVLPSLQRVGDMIELLGLREDHRGYVDAYQATCVFTDGNGATPIEFVVASGGPLATFNRGAGGLHHVAIEVASLDAVSEELARRGMRLLEDVPVRGAGEFQCNFLSPVYTRGVIVELVECLGASPELAGDPAEEIARALQAARAPR